ncbi:MAG: ADP-forming succinate--CoA ligase subunit beta [Pirellulales bacterium]|jgi:succinyl-CoA synthetase beta subunit|nr:ADP-forming succinate--CoA ligase subunit beta [Pirellulales bacterium]MDA0816917.1 ADP-forming succinate--CoA ligase subunit beta [Planctomycetota bacterium]MDA0969175.1 ADP-forming succinate--CoA ligase subunit beta [Planctomycetota bacterium]
MKIHEYQAKDLLRAAGVPVLAGRVVRTPEEASQAFTALGTPVCAVKAQIHAGGRGKGQVKGSEQRGVELAKSPEDAARIARGLLDQTLVTIQTGPEGQVVRQVFVESGSNIERELYCAILVDRAAGSPVLIASTAGGMDIEEVAATTPELILTEPFDPDRGLGAYQTRLLSAKLGLPTASWRAAEHFFRSLTKAFVALDASLLEINPLVLTKEGTLVALDAKMTFDDNALFRHKEVAALRDEAEEEPAEIRAAAAGLSYVKLDGSIGCLVNGAGLAMSTMDLVKLHGGEPANFLDVGGGADVNQVTEAFRIILSDANVKAILVNIFGGIMRCTTIATALVEASKTVGFTVPLVVRLEGTEVEQGKKILAESGTSIITADGLTDAAKKVVAASQA